MRPIDVTEATYEEKKLEQRRQPNQWASRQRSHNRIAKKNEHFLSIYTCSEFVNEQVQQTVWIALNNSKMPRTWKRKVTFDFYRAWKKNKKREEEKKLKNLRTHSKWFELSDCCINSSGFGCRNNLANGWRTNAHEWNWTERMLWQQKNQKKKKFSAVLSLFFFHRLIYVLCGVAWSGVFFACIRRFVDDFWMNERNRNCTHDFIMCIYLITNIINHH